MKYAFSLLVGLLCGTTCALAIIYFNPLTRGQSDVRSATAGWTLDYALSPERTWLSTHDRRLGLPVVPPSVPLLYEEGIRGTILTAMPLAGADSIAAATRVSIPSGDTEFLRSGLLVEDVWLITVPGRGSLFVRALNNQWPLFRDTVVRVDWLRRSFAGSGSYGPTRGPADDGADVVGLTGVYEGARGTGSERLSLSYYNGDLTTIQGQLMIEMVDN